MFTEILFCTLIDADREIDTDRHRRTFSAIVDQSAAILTLHFSKYIHALHVIAFPSGMPSGLSLRGYARRTAARRSLDSPEFVGNGHGTDTIFCSHSSTSTSFAPASDSQVVVPVAIPSPAVPAVRKSARVPVNGARNYTAAGGWWIEP